MADPFLGEIRLFAGGYAPQGWAFCNGQILPIADNEALYALLGNIYGGTQGQNFALPNLQVVLAIGQGQGPGLQNYALAQTGGAYQVTVTDATMPTHTHALMATGADGTSVDPTGNVFAAPPGDYVGYVNAAARTASNSFILSELTLTAEGGNQPHTNMMPTICLSYIIALQGNFPTPN